MNLEQSLAAYLTFLGREEDEPIYLQVIDPRNKLRWSATAVATDLPAAVKLLTDAEDFEAQGDYIVPNRVKKGVEARYPVATWVPDRREEGISDKDIAARRAIYVDCDAVRDAGDGPVRGISASSKEAGTSIGVAVEIANLFTSILGDDTALAFGMSGNGGHVHVAVDNLDPKASEPTVKELLVVTAALFDTPNVKIDTSVADAKRIAPAFGTVKRKGVSIKERPWRQTWFVAAAVAQGRPVQRLSMDELQALVEALRGRLSPEQKLLLEAQAKQKPNTSVRSAANPQARDDLFGRANSIPYGDVMGKLGVPLSCPGCGETTDGGLYAPGNRWHCFRASCQPSSPKGSGNWSAVDAVAMSKGEKPRDAAKLICEAFGLEVRRPGRPRKQLTLDDLLDRTVAAGIDIEQPCPTESPVAASRFALTDLGNAERLVHRHGENLRHVGLWQSWLVWSGSRWQKDETSLVQLRAHETARGIVGEAISAPDDEQRAAVADWATQSESRGRIEAMTSMAECMVPARPDDLNRSALRLNCPNGTLDLRIGDLASHRREDLLTTITEAAYEPYNPLAAKTWESFLRRVQPDPEVRAFLQRLIGVSILGEVREHILPVHNGRGRNGKGTFFETVMHVLGDYAVSVPEELLVDGKGDHPTLLASLYGRRLAVASETEQGDVLAISRLKRLTGGDTISCRRMRENWWEFRPTHLIHLQTNHRPRVLDTGLAAWARLILVGWDVTIPAEEQDKTLRSKLLAEASQVLGWIVEGAIAYLRDGLQIPTSIETATAAWRAEEDLVGQFLAEGCLTWTMHGRAKRAEGLAVQEGWYGVGKKELFTAYVEWAEQSGAKAKGLVNFRKELIDRGFMEERVPGTGERRWVGLGLRADIERALNELDTEVMLDLT